MRTRQTVTRDNWSVSTMTGYGIDGAQLNVFKLRKGNKFQYGDHNRKLFADTDKAFAFALDKGYLKYYKD